MLDIGFIRENVELVKKTAADKKMKTDIDRLLELDEKLRKESRAIDELRSRRNQIAKSSGKGSKMTEESIEEAKKLKSDLAELENQMRETKKDYDYIMLTVPSIPVQGTPVGGGEEDNVEIRRIGSKPVFNFPFKDHIELAEKLDLVDVPRGVKVSGSRSYFLKNEGILLEMALSRFAMDLLNSRGFTPMGVPQLVKAGAMQGTGYFPIGIDQAYNITEDELYLVGTSEVSLVSYYQDEILPLDMLPVRFAGTSSCYRREAGTYGKDTRGLYRVHQFQKVEQVVFCEADYEKSNALHEEILGNTESLLQALELPYRVCDACTAELGIGQIKKNEVESWMPSRDAYCETHSCSSFGDFQARRSNIRYKDENGKTKFVFTLNNTAVASPRILIPLLENNQNEDGSVNIPKALQPYMGGQTVIKPRK